MSSKFSLERRRSLRISTGNRQPALASDFEDCFLAPSTKKLRIRRSFVKLPSLVTLPPKNLAQLPLVVLENLILFLDVTSLEVLSTTSSFFLQLISGRHITSLDFPFSTKFLTELSLSTNIEKKPILSIRSIKTDNTKVPDDMEYMVASQLALLSLTRLRELHLVPRNLGPWRVNSRLWTRFVEFDRILLRQIAGLGGLANISRLDILLDRHCYIDEHMEELPSLLHLSLTVGTIRSISDNSFETFLCRLESTVTACRAPELTVKVLAETRRKVNKVFFNKHVERLVVSAPCNFNLHLAMAALKEVVVNHTDPDHCSFFRSLLTDRILHRSGVCTVSLSSCHKRCPNLLTFGGLYLGHISQDQTFVKWNNRVRKIFHEDYLARGGQKELKAWSRVRGGRWFNRQESLPVNTGHNREVF